MEILNYAVLLIFIVGLVGYIVYKIKKEGLTEVVIQLIIQAENFYEKGLNAEKKKFVVETIQKALPKPLKYLMTTESLDDFVEGIFQMVKPALNNQPRQ